MITLELFEGQIDYQKTHFPDKEYKLFILEQTIDKDNEINCDLKYIEEKDFDKYEFIRFTGNGEPAINSKQSLPVLKKIIYE